MSTSTITLLVLLVLMTILVRPSHTCVSFNKAFAFPYNARIFTQIAEQHRKPVVPEIDPDQQPSSGTSYRGGIGGEFGYNSVSQSSGQPSSGSWPVPLKRPVSSAGGRRVVTPRPVITTSSTSASVPSSGKPGDAIPKRVINADLDDQYPRRSNDTETVLVDMVQKRKPQPLRADADTIVTTSSGRIKGIKGRAAASVVYAFLGIPYAEPPVTGNRFKRTVPVKEWPGILPANTWPAHCVQDFELDTKLTRTLTTHEMSEDCLYLNIWTPTLDLSDLSNQSGKAIIIYLQGGEFKSGTSGFDELDGRVLASLGDLVVVTLNYRLGALGFLDLEAPEVPGNQGLWDIVTAIEWVAGNAGHFGGDSNNITLAGHYSGAVITGLLMLAERSRPLFRRVIMQSGSPLFQEVNDGRANYRTSNDFMQLMGCDGFGAQIKDQLNCLRNKTIDDLLTGQRSLLDRDIKQFGHNYCDTALLAPTTFFESLRNGDLGQRSASFESVDELLLGSNSDEISASLVMAFPDLFSPEKIKLSITTLKELRDLIVRFNRAGNGGHFEDKKAVEFMADYFFADNTGGINNRSGKTTDSKENLVRRMYRVFGDAAIGCPMTILGEEMFKLGKKVYMYEFGHRSKHSPWGAWMGVPFGSEVAYTFGHALRYPQRYSKDDVQVSRRMIGIWSEFAKTGTVPRQLNTEWRAFSNSSQEFVKIEAFEANFGDRETNEVCALFRFTLIESNATQLNCSNVDEDLDVSYESTTEYVETTTLVDFDTFISESNVTAICELFRLTDSADEPTVEYVDYIRYGSSIVTIFNSTALFTCDDHEELIGNSSSLCTEHGNWTAEKPVCKSRQLIERELEAKRLQNFLQTKYLLLRHVVTCELFNVNSSNLFDPIVEYTDYASYPDNVTKMYAISGTRAFFKCLPLSGNETSVTLIGNETALCGNYGIWMPTWKPFCDRKWPITVDDNVPSGIEDTDAGSGNYIDEIITMSLLVVFIGVALCAAYTTFELYRKKWVKKDGNHNIPASGGTAVNSSIPEYKVKLPSIRDGDKLSMANFSTCDTEPEDYRLLSVENGREGQGSSRAGTSVDDEGQSSTDESEDIEVQTILLNVKPDDSDKTKGYALMKLAMANDNDDDGCNRMDTDMNMNEIVPIVESKDIQEAVYVPIGQETKKPEFVRRWLKRK